jgi:hypothetical protein
VASFLKDDDFDVVRNAIVAAEEEEKRDSALVGLARVLPIAGIESAILRFDGKCRRKLGLREPAVGALKKNVIIGQSS